MKLKLKNRKDYRVRRHLRLRHKVRGSAARPRMAIFVSNCHMYVQFVDDDARQTLAQVTTLGMDAKVNMATAKTLGEKAAAAAQEKGIRKIVVDRGGFKFHGRVKMIVESAVAGGLCITTDDAAAGDAGKESK
jgi:large subunit ribosomal protein L18